MRILKKIIIALLAILVLASVGLIVTGNSHIFKGVANTYLKGKIGPSIDEHEIFDSRTLERGDPETWEFHEDFENKILEQHDEEFHEEWQSVAYLVVKEGKILFEKYWEDYDQNTISNSFSMSKSIVGLAAGIAIDQGMFKSLDQKVSDFIPELKENNKENITIGNLVTMATGLNFGESYTDPFGFQAKTYYGSNLFDKALEYPLEKEPGSEFYYQGGNTLLLAKAIENASGMPLSDFVQEYVWEKIGAESDALWNLDGENGFEKASCCFYATARDFARFGQLYLCQGNWEGEQIVSADWVDQSVRPILIPDTSGRPADNYGYHWWLADHKGMDIYSMRGMKGQYVIVIPDKEMVIVRLGRDRSTERIKNHPIDLFEYIDMALKLDV